MDATGFTLPFDLMEEVGKEVGKERERLVEVAKIERWNAMNAAMDTFARTEMPTLEGTTENYVGKPIPLDFPACAGGSWCCLLIDTNENLGWDWMGEEDCDGLGEDEWNGKFSYRLILRDDDLMELDERVPTAPDTYGGWFEDACVDFAIELRVDYKATPDEVMVLFNSWGMDVCDER